MIPTQLDSIVHETCTYNCRLPSNRMGMMDSPICCPYKPRGNDILESGWHSILMKYRSLHLGSNHRHLLENTGRSCWRVYYQESNRGWMKLLLKPRWKYRKLPKLSHLVKPKKKTSCNKCVRKCPSCGSLNRSYRQLIYLAFSVKRRIWKGQKKSKLARWEEILMF